MVGWELNQVTIDKYHVMSFFDVAGSQQLLNIAHSFSFRSADSTLSYPYEVYGLSKMLNVESLLRQRITEVRVRSRRELVLAFENGDELTIHDDPEYCSWWFMPISDSRTPDTPGGWSISDEF